VAPAQTHFDNIPATDSLCLTASWRAAPSPFLLVLPAAWHGARDPPRANGALWTASLDLHLIARVAFTLYGPLDQNWMQEMEVSYTVTC
jgi:hypothetical protein